MSRPPDVERWLADLEARYLRDLTPTEVARALRALSSTYVERRDRLASRGAFDTAGKRAAYALYYGPRRFLLVRAILAELTAAAPTGAVHDLGCGTGAAGVAWATLADPGSLVIANDRHAWAVDETRRTLATFGLRGTPRRSSVEEILSPPPRHGKPRELPGQGAAIVLSYVANELDGAIRPPLLTWLVAASERGARVLVIEPIARRALPWWPEWAAAFVTRGGRADEWKRRLSLPPLTEALGRAAGLDTTSSSARTLWL